MDLVFTPEHDELRMTLRAFLQKYSGESDVRTVMETAEGIDRSTWEALAKDLGLTSLAVPSEFGGMGYGPVETGIVFEEMGRALYCGPYFSVVALATNLLLCSGDSAAMQRYLPAIASGDLIATLAISEPSARWDLQSIEVSATQSGERWLLSGEKMFVTDGLIADLLFVVARSPRGVGVFAVEGSAHGLTRSGLGIVDQTRKQARLEFNNTPAQLVGDDGAGHDIVVRALDLAAVALAAEQVGGASKALEMAIEYAKTRQQFGRPIGSFQAIKHKCADLLLEVESARSAAYFGTWAASNDTDELPVVASLAKAFCSEAYCRAAADCIQIHGGIGFTWEHSAHLYFRRAIGTRALLGDPDYHRELMAQRLPV